MSDSDTNPGRSVGPNSSLDPSRIPLWDIIRGLNTGQAYSIILFAIGIFGAGFGLEGILLSAKYDRDLSEAKQTRDDATRVAANANNEVRAYRAKVEFLNRYISYIQENIPNGPMEKLFVDHVCVLWRQTQSNILSIESNIITLQDLERDRPLSPAALSALAAVGITDSEIDEYRQLASRRSFIEPRTNRFPLPQNADFQRLQNLEGDLGGRIQKSVTTKTVTFFDGSHYDIPQPIATQVHFRADCHP